jgi:hypothetical protein
VDIYEDYEEELKCLMLMKSAMERKMNMMGCLCDVMVILKQ